MPTSKLSTVCVVREVLRSVLRSGSSNGVSGGMSGEVARRDSLCRRLRGVDISRLATRVGTRGGGITLTVRRTLPTVGRLVSTVRKRLGGNKELFCTNYKANKELTALSAVRIRGACNVSNSRVRTVFPKNVNYLARAERSERSSLRGN